MKHLSALTASAVALAVAGTCIISTAPSPAAAEDKIVEAEGVVGDIDNSRRGPIVTFGVKNLRNPNRVQILVDTLMINSQFEKYPIRVDYYVNRELYKSQTRSVELPGALGIEVPESVAAVPFNFQIVATVLHPNRQYITLAQGAAFASDLVGTFDCSLTLTSSGSEEDVALFIANSVQTEQKGNDAFTLAFEADDDTSGEKVQVSGIVSVGAESGSQEESEESEQTGEEDSDLGEEDSEQEEEGSETSADTVRSASSTLAITRDGSTSSVEVTGDISFSEDQISRIDLESSDGTTALACD